MRFQLEKNIYISILVKIRTEGKRIVSTVDITKKAAGSVGQWNR